MAEILQILGVAFGLHFDGCLAEVNRREETRSKRQMSKGKLDRLIMIGWCNLCARRVITKSCLCLCNMEMLTLPSPSLPPQYSHHVVY